MAIKIPLEIEAKGANKAAQDLLKLQQAANSLGTEAKGILELARSLGVTYDEAKKLAAEAGVTGNKIAQMVVALQQLDKANASTEQRFKVLNRTLGINADQYQKLESTLKRYQSQQSAIASESERSSAATTRQVASVRQLAEAAGTLGKSYNEVANLSKKLNLSPESITQGISLIRQLNGVNADNATKYRLLGKELGITEGQFKRLNKASGDSSSGISRSVGKLAGAGAGGVGGLAFAFNNVVGAVGLLAQAGRGAFDLLIGQNAKLQASLIGTQSTLAATNKVFKDGVEIKDPTAAIKALQEPVNEAVAQIRKGSLELVGVTSNDIIPLFQIIAGQSAQIGANLNQSADLALSFGAALQTLGVPLAQSRQEINSILEGQINQDSYLANALNLSNQQVQKWKEQGILVQELNKKLEAFRAGNALNAQSLEGVSSNMMEIFQEITRVAGAPLLDELVANLNVAYKWLVENQAAIQELASTGSEEFLALAQSVGESASRIGEALLPAIKTLGPAAADAASMVLEGLQATAAALAVVAEATGPAIEKAAELVDLLVKGLRRAQDVVGFLSGGMKDSTEATAQLQGQTEALLQSAATAEGRYQNALDASNRAKAEKRKLTEEEKKAQQAAITTIDNSIASIKGQMSLLNQAVPIGDKNREGIEKQKDALKEKLKVLEADSRALKENAGGVKLLSNASADLAPKIKQIGEAYEKQAAQISAAEARSLADLAKAQADGTKTKAQVESAKLKITQDRIDAELKAEKERLGKLSVVNEKGNEGAIKAQEERIADVRKQNAEAVANASKVSDEAAQKARLEGEKKLAAEVARLAELKKKPEEQEKEITASKTRIAKLEKDAAEGRLAIEQDALNRLVQANEEADKKITKSQENRIVTLKQKQLDALKAGVDPVEIERQTQAEILKVQQGSLNQQVAAKQKALADLKKAEADGTVPKEEAKKQEQALQSDLAKLNQQRIEAEINAIQAQKEEEIRQIERVAARNKLAHEEILAQIEQEGAARLASTDKELSAIDARKRALDLERKTVEDTNALLESRSRLQSALSDLRVASAENELSMIRQAAEARKFLDENAEISADRRARIEAFIYRTVGATGGTQLNIANAIAEKENQIAKIKRQQLIADQAADRAKLEQENRQRLFTQQQAELDTRRDVLVARRAVIEAEISRQKAVQTAQQREQEALDALKIARTKGDKDETAAAEQKLRLAKQQNDSELQLADQLVANSKEQLQAAEENKKAVEAQRKNVEEINQNAILTLNAQQETARATYDAAEGARQFRQELELASAESAQIKQNLDGSQRTISVSSIEGRRLGGSVEGGVPYIVGEEGQELFVPDTPGWIMTAAQTARLLSNLNPVFNIPATSSPIATKDASLLDEVRRLRHDLQGLQAKPGPQTYQFINESNPIQKVIEVQQAMMQARYR